MHQIQREIKEKERARETLAKRFCKGQLSQDEIRLCLYSISDNNSYLLFNRDPVDKMIGYLQHYFQCGILLPSVAPPLASWLRCCSSEHLLPHILKDKPLRPLLRTPLSRAGPAPRSRATLWPSLGVRTARA